MPRQRTVTVEVSGDLLSVNPGDRRGRWLFWRKEDVPEFARAGGRMIVEPIPGGWRPSHRIVAPAPEGT